MLKTRPSKSSWVAAATLAAEREGVSVCAVLAGSRKAAAVRARWSAWAAMMENSRHSLPQMAEVTGFDHTTIMYGLRRAAGASSSQARSHRALRTLFPRGQRNDGGCLLPPERLPSPSSKEKGRQQLRTAAQVDAPAGRPMHLGQNGGAL